MSNVEKFSSGVPGRRGFVVLDEFKELVVDIMKANPDEYEISEEERKHLSVAYGDEDYWLPRRETPGSAGYDIRSIEDTIVMPNDLAILGTGLTTYMPLNEELDIRSRSGLSAKYRVMVINSPGTIDSDYYGKHVMVMLYNLGSEPLIVKKGDRIAQGVFHEYLIVENDNPKKKERVGGLGSTGV